MRVAIEGYNARGFVVHPLSKPDDKGKSPGKRPLITRWQNLTATPQDINKFISQGCNIGLVCGKASGVTLLDFDHYLFVNDLFNDFDPETLKSIRTEGRGHVYFKYNPNLPASKHHDLGIEVLSDGNNAVIPPSIHVSGDVYKWNDIDAPIIEMPKVLEDKLKELFHTETLLKQIISKCRTCFKSVLKDKKDMHGAEGREYMIAISTDLKANGATEQHIKMFARLIYKKEYDEARTLQEWANIDPSKTWKCETLKAKLPAFVSCDTCKHDNKQSQEQPTTYTEMDLKEIKALQQKESNRHLKINLPSDHFITEYMKWLSSLSDGYEDYQIVSGLWILSALTHGRAVFRLKQEAIKPNLWIFIIGKSTTSRKSTIVNKSRQMFEVANDINLPNQDYSLEGYLETLSLNPILNNVRDEAAGLLAKFHKKYNEGILELECQIYDGQDTEKTLASNGKKEPKIFHVKKPYVTKLYATTPDNLARYMSVDDFTCGYGFRFLFVNPNYKHDRKPLEVETAEDNEAWGKILIRIKNLAHYFDNLKADILFKVQPEAMSYYNKVVHELEDKVDELNNDMLNSALGRGQAHILKIAMLLELGKKEISTTITIKSIEIAAQMITEYFIPSMMDMIDRLQEDVKINKIEKIISVLRRLGGVATHTEVLRNSKLVGKEFNECVTTMYESKTIDIQIDKETKAKIYRLIDSNKPIHPTHQTHKVPQYTQDINNVVN